MFSLAGLKIRVFSMFLFPIGPNFNKNSSAISNYIAQVSIK